MDSDGGVGQTDAKLGADMLFKSPLCVFNIYLHLSAKEIIWVEVPENQITVCDRRLCPAYVVASRPGFGTRALRPNV
jgi:hypothetical protein